MTWIFERVIEKISWDAWSSHYYDDMLFLKTLILDDSVPAKYRYYIISWTPIVRHKYGRGLDYVMRELYVGMKFLSSTDGGLSVLTDHEVSKSDYHLALADRIGAGEVNKDVSVEDTNPILTGGHKMKIVINGVEHHIKFSLEASSKIDTGDDPTIVMLGKTVVVKSGSVLQPYAVEKIDELVSSKISDCLKSLNDE